MTPDEDLKMNEAETHEFNDEPTVELSLPPVTPGEDDVPLSKKDPEVRTSSFDILQFEEQPDDSEVSLVLQSETVHRKAPEPGQMLSVVIDHRKSLGEALVTVRAAAGLSMEEVEEKTRIKMGYLKALESDDEENLPQKVYVAAYVRSLCKLYRLDDATAKQLLDHLAEPVEDEEIAEENKMPEKKKPVVKRKTNRKVALQRLMPLIVFTFVLALVVLGIAILVKYFMKPDAPATDAAPPPAKVSVDVDNQGVAPSSMRQLYNTQPTIAPTEVPER